MLSTPNLEPSLMEVLIIAGIDTYVAVLFCSWTIFDQTGAQTPSVRAGSSDLCNTVEAK